MVKQEPLEPVLKLLAGLMVFFTAILFVSEKFFPSDGQIFQVVSGLLTGISGAFLMRIKPRATGSEVEGNSVTTATTTVSVPVEPLK